MNLLFKNLKWDDGPVSGPQRILVLARSVSMLGNFAAPVALSFAVLASMIQGWGGSGY